MPQKGKRSASQKQRRKQEASCGSSSGNSVSHSVDANPYVLSVTASHCQSDPRYKIYSRGRQCENENLENTLQRLRADLSDALLLCGSMCIAVFRDRSGRFGYFDSHCRTAYGMPDEDESTGTAVMLTFFRLEDMIERLMLLFASYQHFQAFWQFVESAVNTKMVRVTSASGAGATQHRSTKLAPIDELLLFLMHLSIGLSLRDLANRFGIHRTTVSRIITTWTHFLYHLLGSIRLWLPKEVVQAHLPPEFSQYADTQVVLDCTEIFCQTPSSLVLQSEVFSNYKSHTTFKAMIGIAPHGPITFVSPLYAGSMSDREIF
ncbi:unnamed protein product [Leuciscus chuanchicus]